MDIHNNGPLVIINADSDINVKIIKIIKYIYKSMK